MHEYTKFHLFHEKCILCTITTLLSDCHPSHKEDKRKGASRNLDNVSNENAATALTMSLALSLTSSH